MGQSIKIFFGVLLFPIQFILALIVALARMLPEGTIGIHGASRAAQATTDFLASIFEDDYATPVQKTKPTPTRKRAVRKKATPKP